MPNQLTTEQVLLLNNLMYTSEKKPLKGLVNTEAKTVGEFIDSIDITKLDGNKDYGSFITGNDWKQIIAAVNNDSQLRNIQITQKYVASKDNGGGVSVLFVNPVTNEAIVAFRGTASLEWKDNFVGGAGTNATDGVSTQYQEHALEWYRSLKIEQYNYVTVTGHSKGGNKAKYITVLENSVDRCLSFDGQGFSDEFYDVYKEQIIANQGKITNHNVESDYVNILLNDIGKTNYYQGFEYGEGGFLENHCPNTFMNFISDDEFQMILGNRDERLTEADKFFNSFLRSLSKEDKQETLAVIGEMVELGFNDADVSEILDVLLEDNNVEYAAYLTAYLIKYQEAHPELIDALNGVLSDMEMDSVVNIINSIVAVMNWKYFEQLLGVAAWVSEVAPDFLYELLQDFLQKKGIELSIEELKKITGVLQLTANAISDVKLYDDGKDYIADENFKVDLNKDIFLKNGLCEFSIDIERNRMIEDCLLAYRKELENHIVKIDSIYSNLSKCTVLVKETLKEISSALDNEAQVCQVMKDTLYEIRKKYECTEKGIVGAMEEKIT